MLLTNTSLEKGKRIVLSYCYKDWGDRPWNIFGTTAFHFLAYSIKLTNETDGYFYYLYHRLQLIDSTPQLKDFSATILDRICYSGLNQRFVSKLTKFTL